MELCDELLDYIPYNIQEEADRKVMLRYLRDFSNVYTRENVYGHITSSPWIINADASRVLMIYHNIYDSWGWCGGHADGDRDLIHVALKEGTEETGLKHLQLLDKRILAIDILPVPPHMKRGAFVSAHVHLNVTYLCQADEQEALTSKPDENSGVKWIPVEEIEQIVTEEDMKPVYRKLMEKSRSLLRL
ncbi:NUDIX hydrolase [[Clostridium] innocuum]|nr:NUDIX hydrolase [[Clostridium] innocuum]